MDQRIYHFATSQNANEVQTTRKTGAYLFPVSAFEYNNRHVAHVRQYNEGRPALHKTRYCKRCGMKDRTINFRCRELRLFFLAQRLPLKEIVKVCPWTGLT